jgi:ER-bound oxygenase mpaB/B'/Rubber oxygenase, catalytic domain
MLRRTILDEMRRLDAEKDCQRIVYLLTYHEFPFDTLRAVEFALYRAFAVPSISSLLNRTGEFQNRPQKRYDDTQLILSEIFENGYESDRGKAAITRLNHIHGRFQISNDDFLYVLSAFIFESIRWITRFGWRPMLEQERLGIFYCWREVGRRMNIQGIPDTIDELEQYNVEYERLHFKYSDTNRKLGIATRDLFLSWYLPRPLRWLGRPLIYAAMDDRLLDAFGFPKPSAAVRRIVEGLIRFRGRLIRLLPERRRPQLLTTKRHRSYPDGYRLNDLGPTRPH